MEEGGGGLEPPLDLPLCNQCLDNPIGLGFTK